MSEIDKEVCLVTQGRKTLLISVTFRFMTVGLTLFLMNWQIVFKYFLSVFCHLFLHQLYCNDPVWCVYFFLIKISNWNSCSVANTPIATKNMLSHCLSQVSPQIQQCLGKVKMLSDTTLISKPVCQELVVNNFFCLCHCACAIVTVCTVASRTKLKQWRWLSCWRLFLFVFFPASDTITPCCAQVRGSALPLQAPTCWNLWTPGAWTGAAGPTWVHTLFYTLHISEWVIFRSFKEGQSMSLNFTLRYQFNDWARNNNTVIIS